MSKSNFYILSAIFLATLVILAFILLVNNQDANINIIGKDRSTVSVYEHQVVTSKYNASSRTITIQNETDVFADITLITPLRNFVQPGIDMQVAELNFSIYRQVNNFVGVLETYNIKDAMKNLSKGYTWKYAKFQQRNVTDYLTTCNLVNRTGLPSYQNCTDVVNGTKSIIIKNWTNINWNNAIPANDYVVGLFADVDVDERVEWIPNIANLRINQWASWDSSLSNGLFAYYNFTDYNNSLNSALYPLIKSAGTPTLVTGKSGLGTAINCSIGSVRQVLNYTIFNLNESSFYTINFWDLRYNASGAERYMMSKDDAGASNWYLGHESTGNMRTWGMSTVQTAWSFQNNSWNMHTITCNATACVYYTNGVRGLTGTKRQQANLTTTNLVICDYPSYASNFNGLMDEIGFWNVTLSDAAVSTLYANGSGMTYAPSGGPTDDYPKYSNLWNTTNPVDYTYNGVYYFNATWIDGGGNGSMSVQFIFDNVGYTPANNSDVYYANRTNLKAGLHNFSWVAIDAGININQTNTFYFNITKANPIGLITLLPSNRVTNGTATIANATESNLGDLDLIYNLTRDGVDVSNPDSQTFLTIGERNYTFRTDGGENYSAIIMDSEILNITGFGWPWPSNQFNDTSTIGNLTFTSSNQTITTYVAVPDTVSLVTLAIMNLTGFGYTNGLTPTSYKGEYPIQGGASCGMTANSTNIFVLDCNDALQIYNMSFNNKANLTLSLANPGIGGGLIQNGTNIFYLASASKINITDMQGNYLSSFSIYSGGTTPIGLTTNGTNLFYTISSTIDSVFNYNLDGTYQSNFSTFNNPTGIGYLNGYLYVLDNTDDRVHLYYPNGTDANINFTLNAVSNGFAFYLDSNFLYRVNGTSSSQDRVGVYYMTSYPNNLNITIGNQQVFYYPNQFEQVNNRTSNFASVMTDYLSTCSYSNGYCQVPVNFLSSTPGILQYSDMYYTDEGIYLSNITYNANTYETASENFTFTFTAGNIIFAKATLNYNGVNYISNTTCSNNVCVASNTLDIPKITSGNQQNNTFYWNVNLFDGTSSSLLNTSSYNQSVSKLSMTYCPTGGNVALNFTAYDEQNKTRLKPFDFEGSIQYYLGSGSVYNELNISNSSATDVLICTIYNQTHYVNAIISYNNGSYPTRNYFYQRWPVNNITQRVPLYLLGISSSTYFVLQVQDRNLQAMKGVLVNAQRCYPGVNSNETVFIHRTDSNGLTVGNLEAQTALYQFFITNQSNTLLSVTPCASVVPQTVPYTLLFQLGATYTSPFTNIENASDIVSTFTFNNSIGLLTWTYIDTSNVFNYSQLIVSSLNYSGANPIVCSSNNSISSGVITCNLSIAGTYSARGYVYRNNQILFEQYVFTYETRSSTVGYYGVFLAFFLILISAFAFKFNEIAGIALINIVVIFCNVVGLVNFGVTFITAMIGISIIIVGVLER